MKKIFSIFIILSTLFYTATVPVSAKKVDPLNLDEKISYVNIDFISRFSDPYLTGYVQEGIQNNHNVRKASWVVEEYRQNVKSAFARELPSLSVGANYLGLNAGGAQNFQTESRNSFVMPVIARYEPDFLLKNRDKTKSEKKSYEASQMQEKSVYISLVSDIAVLYINILQYDSLIQNQQKIVAINEEILARSNKKFKYGVIDSSSLNLAKKELETAKNSLEELVKAREISLNQLELLLGRTSGGTIERGKLENFEYQSQIPDTITSDIIFSRPDVLEAESRLEKAKIDVRVARKELLPRFNITGTMIFSTLFPGNFFGWDNTIATLLAGATQDLFQGGGKLANLRLYKARYEQLFENYRQTDLNAVREVNDALMIVKTDTAIDANTLKKLQLQTSDYTGSGKKFKQGAISYPDLLFDQQLLLTSQQNYIRSKTTRLVNYVTLYKAVGGKL